MTFPSKTENMRAHMVKTSTTEEGKQRFFVVIITLGATKSRCVVEHKGKKPGGVRLRAGRDPGQITEGAIAEGKGTSLRKMRGEKRKGRKEERRLKEGKKSKG